eukprot:2039588-Rhodomonas_salina.1
MTLRSLLAPSSTQLPYRSTLPRGTLLRACHAMSSTDCYGCVVPGDARRRSPRHSVDQGVARVSCYELAMRCPVLTKMTLVLRLGTKLGRSEHRPRVRVAS